MRNILLILSLTAAIKANAEINYIEKGNSKSPATILKVEPPTGLSPGVTDSILVHIRVHSTNSYILQLMLPDYWWLGWYADDFHGLLHQGDTTIAIHITAPEQYIDAIDGIIFLKPWPYFYYISYNLYLVCDRSPLTDEDLQGLPYSTVKELVTAFCPVLKTVDYSCPAFETKPGWYERDEYKPLHYLDYFESSQLIIKNTGNVIPSPSIQDVYENWGSNNTLDNIDDYPDYNHKYTIYATAYKSDNHIIIQYWFLYFNNFVIRADLTPSGLEGAKTSGDHEGDWESIAILLDQNEKPETTYYARHRTSSGEKRDWANTPKYFNNSSMQGTIHPVVYVAYGTHASYYYPGYNSLPQKGKKYIDIHTGDGLWWFPPQSDYTSDHPHHNLDSVIVLPRLNHISPQDPLRWMMFAGNWGKESSWPGKCPGGPARHGLQWLDAQLWACSFSHQDTCGNINLSAEISGPNTGFVGNSMQYSINVNLNSLRPLNEKGILYIIKWGDNTQTTGTFWHSQQVNIEESHIYNEEGNYTISVDVYEIMQRQEDYEWFAHNNIQKEIIIYPQSSPQATILNGLAWLADNQTVNGDLGYWEYEGYPSVGVTALAVLAFKGAGYDQNDLVVQRALNYITSPSNVHDNGAIYAPHWSDRSVYETAMAIVALNAIDPDQYADIIENAKTYLINGRNPDGGWRYYANYGYSDLSVTQWPVLALHAIGYSNESVWDGITSFASSCFDPGSGGFRYRPGSAVRGAMTGAGLWCYMMHPDPGMHNAPQVEAGYQWIENHYTLDHHPGVSPGTWMYYYYLYSIAKALELRGSTYLGEHNWYQDLYTNLDTLQEPDGHWAANTQQEAPDFSTILAVLALEVRTIPPNSKVEFELASHCDLHIYDPQGRHVGMNYDADSVEIYIPNASFTWTPDSHQIITIDPLTEAGRYTYQLKGTSSGPFELTVRAYEDTVLVASDGTSGQIEPGMLLGGFAELNAIEGHLTLFFSPPEVLPSMQVDPNSFSYTISPGGAITGEFTISEIGGSSDILDVTVFANDLTDPNGNVIPADSFDILPFTIDTIPAGSSVTVTFSLYIPEDQPPGFYDGHITIETANAGAQSVHLTVNVSSEMSFEVHNGRWKLRMFSLPVEPADATVAGVIEDDLGPWPGDGWYLFWWDGHRYRTYGNDTGFPDTLKVGDAYFFFSMFDATFEITGSPVNASPYFPIHIRRGYTQIGDPFVYPVNWPDVMVAYQGDTVTIDEADSLCWVKNALWYWDPDSGYIIYQSPDGVLEPTEGYWVCSDVECDLLIPAQTAILASKPAGAEVAITPPGKEGWSVNVRVNMGSARDLSNYFGVLQEASDGYDRHDIEDIAAMNPAIALMEALNSMLNQNKNGKLAGFDQSQVYSPRNINAYFVSGEHLLMKDFKKDIGNEGQNTWILKIRAINGKGETAHVKFDGVDEIPENYTVYLYDPDNNTLINLRENSEYEYKIEEEDDLKELQILVTSENKPELKVYGLAQNTPNPFSDFTRIVYSIPENTEVTLKIYDATGRLVRTLVHGTQKAGIKKIRWDGTDNAGRKLPSGLYFYRLETEKFRATKRMLLLR